MSRYLILVLLNLPLIITAIVGIFVSYKLNNTSKRRLIIKTVFWVGILLCLVFAQNIYTYLYNEGLTQTEPLSLFDVLQITGIIYVFYLVNRLFTKVTVLERRLQDLHQELSIILSGKNGKN